MKYFIVSNQLESAGSALLYKNYARLTPDVKDKSGIIVTITAPKKRRGKIAKNVKYHLKKVP